MAAQFGSQCVVVAMDIRFMDDNWTVHSHGGTRPTKLEACDWAAEVERRGAGEILLTSMDHDGTKAGFALDITRKISQVATIPVIASGGAGTPQHFLDLLVTDAADAALAASIFHFNEVAIPDLKSMLRSHNVSVRI